jgi:hypothetical protein
MLTLVYAYIWPSIYVIPVVKAHSENQTGI